SFQSKTSGTAGTSSVQSKTSGTAGTSSVQNTTSAPASLPLPTGPPTQAPAVASSTAASESASTGALANAYGQAASNIVAGSNLEQTVQQLMDMGGGNWDKDTVLRALRAAYNNPERAGIPASAEVAVPAPHIPSNQAPGPPASATGAPISGLPNSSPLNMFPQRRKKKSGERKRREKKNGEGKGKDLHAIDKSSDLRSCNKSKARNHEVGALATEQLTLERQNALGVG
ncbi:hypothetical protein Taro_021013, partial [Colocasia esculenta]|nr:hypothetical protein [Colocasia esculenta]